LKAIYNLSHENVRCAPVFNKLSNQVKGALDIRDVVKCLIFQFEKLKEKQKEKEKILNQRSLFYSKNKIKQE